MACIIRASSSAELTRGQTPCEPICLTCIIAHDNAKLHTIQKKNVIERVAKYR